MSQKRRSTSSSSESKRSKRSNEDGGQREEEEEGFLSCGIIESVELINFKNHAHTTVELGPHVSFISGQNGSGKSAVLQAISFSLGASSGTLLTGGGSLKQLIQEGKRSARVIIKLRNRGPDAYRHHDYGDSILVERVLHLSGSSDYRTRRGDGRGEIVGKSRKEVQSICDAFNIAISNPVSVLMQEQAKKFLTSANPKAKYAFFCEATQLSDAEKEYMNAMTLIKSTATTVKRQREALPLLKAAFDTLDAEYTQMRHLHDKHDAILQHKDELVVGLVLEQEKKCADLDGVVRHMRSKVEEHEAAAAKADAEVSSFNNEVTAKKKEVDALTKESNVAKARHQELRQENRGKRSELARLEEECERARKDLHGLEKRLERMQRSAVALAEKAESERASLDARESAHRSKQEELDNAVRDARDVFQEFDGRVPAARAAKEASDEKLRDLSTKREHCKRDLYQKKSALDQARQSVQERLARIHRDAPRVDAALRMEMGRHAPIGPIGDVLELTDNDWAMAVEQCVRVNLKSYVVTSHEQAKRAADIVRRLGSSFRPSFIVQRAVAAVHDTGNVSGGVPTVLSKIDATKVPVPVLNTLIDHNKVELTLLFETERDAENGMFGNRRPNGCTTAYNKIGVKFFCSDGRQSTVEPRDHSPRIVGMSSADLVERAQQALEESQRAFNVADEAFNALRSEGAMAKRAYQEATEKAMSAETAMQDAERKANRHRDDRPQNEQRNHADELAALESVITETRREHREQEEVTRVADEKLAALQGPNGSHHEEEAAKALVERLAKDLVQLTDSVAELRSQANGAAKAKAIAAENANGVRKVVEEQEAVLEEARRKAVAARARMEEQFRDIGREIPAPSQYSVQDLQELIVNKQRELDAARAGGRPIEDVIRERETAKLKYEHSAESTRGMRRWVAHMDRSLEQRMFNLQKMRLTLAARISSSFNLLLSQMGHSGSLDFDHEKRHLAVNVRVRGEGGEQRSTLSLSGGERMVATISLLLSCWKAMGSPWRILDEFDVYLDAPSRAVSMTLLCKAARDDKTKQYIFITPHNLGDVPTGPDVRVIKMRRPDRAQSTLN